MKKEAEILLSLLQSAVSGTGANLPPATLANVDWYAVMRMAEQQRVAAVAYDGLLINNISLDETTRLTWSGMVAATELTYRRHLQTIGQIASLISTHSDINTAVIKGMGCSTLYPIPKHRAQGDIDLFLWRRDDKGVHCCQQEGDALISKHLGISVDSSHPHHTVFYLNNIMVENHYNFINIVDMPSSRRVEQRLIELSQGEWRATKLHASCKTGTCSTSETTLYLPPVAFDTLFLSRHMARHFSGTNVILRQMFDWALFVRRYHDEIDWGSAVRDWQAFAMLPFVECMNTICGDVLLGDASGDLFHGVTSNNKALCDKILNEVLEPRMGHHYPKGRQRQLSYRLRRFVTNGWKRKITYEESTPKAFVSLSRAHLKRRHKR